MPSSSQSKGKELKLKKRVVYTYEYGSDDGDDPYGTSVDN